MNLYYDGNLHKFHAPSLPLVARELLMHTIIKIAMLKQNNFIEVDT